MIYGTLYNYQPTCVDYRTLCSTDGYKQESDYLRYDAISKVFRYPGDTVWLEYQSIYTHHDNCNYSESNDKYILNVDAIYCEDAQAIQLRALTSGAARKVFQND